MKRELICLRTSAKAIDIGILIFNTSSFKISGNQKFSEVDVGCISVIEKIIV